MALLEVNHLNISFGGLHAVDDFHVSIEKGQLYGLIGPNGAGKTTIFNLLTGVYKPDEGIINLDGQDITGKSTIDINKAGIARTFQNIRLFHQQSVIDNVKIGLHNEHTYSTLSGILRLPSYRKTEKIMNEKAMELLKKLGLETKADAYPCELSGGQSQRVSIARALALEPKILFFDEPTSALDPELTGEVLKVIKSLTDLHITMVIVTHEMAFAKEISDRIIFMDKGVIIEDASPDEVFSSDNERTREFLGKYHDVN